MGMTLYSWPPCPSPFRFINGYLQQITLWWTSSRNMPLELLNAKYTGKRSNACERLTLHSKCNFMLGNWCFEQLVLLHKNKVFFLISSLWTYLLSNPDPTELDCNHLVVQVQLWHLVIKQIRLFVVVWFCQSFVWLKIKCTPLSPIITYYLSHINLLWLHIILTFPENPKWHCYWRMHLVGTVGQKLW